MNLIWWTIAVAAVAVWVITLVELFRSRQDRKHLFAWLLIVLLLPFLGSVLFWMLRKPSQSEIDQQVAAQADLRTHSPFDPHTR